MKLNEIKAISVVGAGIMGHGIAQSFLMGGYPVMLYDIKESILGTAKAHIEHNLELFGQAGLIKSAESKRALGSLVATTELQRAVEKSDFIVEAAPEHLELKQALFQE